MIAALSLLFHRYSRDGPGVLCRGGIDHTRQRQRRAKRKSKDEQMKSIISVLKVCYAVWVDLDRFGDVRPTFDDSLGKTAVSGPKGG